MSIGFGRTSVTAVAALALLVAGSAFYSAPVSSATNKDSDAAHDKMAAGHGMRAKMASKSSSMAAGSSAVSYRAAQAAAGDKAYSANCAQCHGTNLEGGVGPALSGGTLNTLAKNTKLTVGDMFTFISQQMPLNAPATLSHDKYASIMAYILKFNGYPAGATALTYASAGASKVVIKSKK